MQTILLIGASNTPSRYSRKALDLLLSLGYRVIPVHPREQINAPEPTLSHLSKVYQKIDIAVVYIRPELLKVDINELIRIAPQRVIFSPGTESPELAGLLETNGIKTENACTLVLLSLGKFSREEY